MRATIHMCVPRAPGDALLILLAPLSNRWVHLLNSIERRCQRGVRLQRRNLCRRLCGAELADEVNERIQEVFERTVQRFLVACPLRRRRARDAARRANHRAEVTGCGDQHSKAFTQLLAVVAAKYLRAPQSDAKPRMRRRPQARLSNGRPRNSAYGTAGTSGTRNTMATSSTNET